MGRVQPFCRGFAREQDSLPEQHPTRPEGANRLCRYSDTWCAAGPSNRAIRPAVCDDHNRDQRQGAVRRIGRHIDAGLSYRHVRGRSIQRLGLITPAPGPVSSGPTSCLVPARRCHCHGPLLCRHAPLRRAGPAFARPIRAHHQGPAGEYPAVGRGSRCHFLETPE